MAGRERMVRIVVRWLIRASLLGLLVAGCAIDSRLKSPSGEVYRPAAVDWTVTTPNLALFWSNAGMCDAVRRFALEWPPLSAFELAVRKNTGIRPTPSRWRLWLGPTFSASGSKDEVGYCVHPGLLLHAAHRLLATLGTKPDSGVFQYRTWHYAWRNGSLVFSDSADYVRAALDAPPVRLDPELRSGQVRLERFGDAPATLTLAAGKTVRVQGSLGIPVAARGKILAFAAPAGNEPTPLFEAAAPSPADLANLAHALDVALAPLAGWKAVSAAIRPLLAPAPTEAPAADAQPTSSSVLVFDLRTEGQAPLTLQAALSTAFLSDPANPSSAILRTSATDATTSKLVAEGYATPEPVEGDVVLRADWQRVGQAALAFMQAKAEAGELGEGGFEAIEKDYKAPLMALRQLGTVRLVGQAKEGKLEFSGDLTSTTEKAPPVRSRPAF